MKKIKCKLLETPNELANGLMFKSGTVLMKLPYKQRAVIHTFFCKPMIIAWLDKKMKVLELVYAKPFRIYLPKHKAKYVFESTNPKIRLSLSVRVSCVLE